jgi:uncharacterized membrane protein YadS
MWPGGKFDCESFRLKGKNAGHRVFDHGQGILSNFQLTYDGANGTSTVEVNQKMSDQRVSVTPEGGDVERAGLRISEDWLAVVLGGVLIVLSLVGVFAGTGTEPGPVSNPVTDYLGTPGKWSASPGEAFADGGVPVVGSLLLLFSLFSVGTILTGNASSRFPMAFAAVLLMACFVLLLAGQKVVKYYGLEYALWALLLGLLISNSVGVPRWLRPAVRGELFIKTGLVLLGAEVLFGKLVALGLPGICISWIVTPIVLISTYWFGQRVLKIESRSLNMVISADMSVCGVSAAIATAASCRAKKEELSTAVGISLGFTVLMMIVMPGLVKTLGLDEVTGGAWMGGTIDSTGAVAVAGTFLGEKGELVATTVKMIQNVLIGVISFGVALYWVSVVDRKESEKPQLSEVWRRIPRFIFGFLAASILVSLMASSLADGEAMAGAVKAGTKPMRSWCFCLAFVCIGLDTQFRTLAANLRGGKPLILYVCGQFLNLLLTLLMSVLMFRILFPDISNEL